MNDYRPGTSMLRRATSQQRARAFQNLVASHPNPAAEMRDLLSTTRCLLSMTDANAGARQTVHEIGDDDASSDVSETEVTDPAARLAATASASNPGQGKPKPAKLDPKLVGMSVGAKNLYAGKEDRRGRFQWMETLPAYVQKSTENAETQKWALIVRYVKSNDDPRKSLAIHSIVVQSPLLREVLKNVLAGYPGVTVGLQRLEFKGKPESLIHRFPLLNAGIDRLKKEMSQTNGDDTITRNGDTRDQSTNGEETETTATVDDSTPVKHLDKKEMTIKHAELLRDLLITEFEPAIVSAQDMKAQGVMTYEHLWTLFEPGHLIYGGQEGQDRVFRLQSAKYGFDKDQNPAFLASLFYITFDGTRFGWAKTTIKITSFDGTRAITSLTAYPLVFHPDLEALKARIIERGARLESFCGTHYRSYEGIGWRFNSYGKKEMQSVNGRIIIDAVGWNRYQPNMAIFVAPLDKVGSAKEDTASDLRERKLQSELAQLERLMDDFEAMPVDGRFAAEEEQKRRRPLTDEEKLLCTHLIRGYALKEKTWLNLFVNSVQDIEFDSRAFGSLVLPENQKELILGFTSTQQAYRNSYDDVIQGKGRGIILLLCGPPGVGKTLTAESVAEEMKVPLYVMSAADLGYDSKSIEARLLTVLGMCTRWNAVLLLDEADIFLEARSLHEIERNKLVSIFLRVLEYHEGIMFLTTNRVSTFDPAFQSRIHISIDYPELSSESRRTIWDNFLKQHNLTQIRARASPPKNPISAIVAAVGGDSSSTTEGQDGKESAREIHEAVTRPHAIEPQQVRELSRLELNGRQIKNVIKSAQLMANHKREPLKHSHVVTVLDVAQHLHNASQATKRAQSSLFN